MKDPKISFRHLIQNNWDKNETSYDGVPEMHTGWYDRNSGGPQITFTNTDEVTANAGDTGITAINNSGGISQVKRGTILINCWSGTREELENQGFANEDINPKKLAFEMKELTVDIVEDHADGVFGGTERFNTVGINRVTDIPDTEDEFRQRYEVQPVYTYVK